MHIDGRRGEGGGQVLRTSLTLALLTGQAFQIDDIRGGRKRPGLLRQHATCVEAAKTISGARTVGAKLRSSSLYFEPGPVRPGDYAFHVGSAGSAGLVLQTILLPLALAGGTSHVTITGGTHNRAAPPYPFLAETFLPLLRRMGFRVELQMTTYGFYPAGGGTYELTVEAPEHLRPLELLAPLGATTLSATAIVAQLGAGIAHREAGVYAERLGIPRSEIVATKVRSRGPGNATWVTVGSEEVDEVIVGFGERGRTAESVAGSVADEVEAYLTRGAPVGEHLCDQLMLPMAITGGAFLTGPLSLHAQTQAELIERFAEITIARARTDADRWRVAVPRVPTSTWRRDS